MTTAPIITRYDYADLISAAALEGGVVAFEPLERIAARLAEADRLAYLATPYTHLAVLPDGRWNYTKSLDAQNRATLWTARFAALGQSVFSPIVLSAEMCHAGTPSIHANAPPIRFDPLDAGFWTRWCQPFLERCDAVVVPPIPGWDESDGIWAEVHYALGTGKPVYLVQEGRG